MPPRDGRPDPDRVGTSDDLAQQLSTIQAHVLKLREAGVHVTHIRVDSGMVDMKLESLDAAGARQPRQAKDPADPMEDPASYGLAPGSRVPGFDRPTRDEE